VSLSLRSLPGYVAMLGPRAGAGPVVSLDETTEANPV